MDRGRRGQGVTGRGWRGCAEGARDHEAGASLGPGVRPAHSDSPGHNHYAPLTGEA